MGEATTGSEAVRLGAEFRRLSPHRKALFLAAAAPLVLGAGTYAAGAVPQVAGPLAAVLTLSIAVGAVALMRRLRTIRHVGERLAELASVDPETGLGDAAELEAELRRQIEHSERRRTPLGIVMVSVEDVRRLNVERGLAAGRRFLHQAAAALSTTAGAHGGRTFRAHGHALVAVIPNTTHADAERLALKVTPSLSLLMRRNGYLARLVAGGAVALPGDLPEDVVLRAEKRCAALLDGSEEVPASVLRGIVPPTH